jgi:hypothetical protein
MLTKKDARGRSWYVMQQVRKRGSKKRFFREREWEIESECWIFMGVFIVSTVKFCWCSSFNKLVFLFLLFFYGCKKGQRLASALVALDGCRGRVGRVYFALSAILGVSSPSTAASWVDDWGRGGRCGRKKSRRQVSEGLSRQPPEGKEGNSDISRTTHYWFAGR